MQDALSGVATFPYLCLAYLYIFFFFWRVRRLQRCQATWRGAARQAQRRLAGIGGRMAPYRTRTPPCCAATHRCACRQNARAAAIFHLRRRRNAASRLNGALAGVAKTRRFTSRTHYLPRRAILCDSRPRGAFLLWWRNITGRRIVSRQKARLPGTFPTSSLIPALLLSEPGQKNADGGMASGGVKAWRRGLSAVEYLWATLVSPQCALRTW